MTLAHHQSYITYLRFSCSACPAPPQHPGCCTHPSCVPTAERARSHARPPAMRACNRDRAQMQQRAQLQARPPTATPAHRMRQQPRVPTLRTAPGRATLLPYAPPGHATQAHHHHRTGPPPLMFLEFLEWSGHHERKHEEEMSGLIWL